PHRHGGGDQGKREDQIIEKDGAVDRAELESEARSKALVRRIEWDTEESRPRDAADSSVAVGHGHPVDQNEPNDFAEAERHDGEIVAAQSQHGKAEQDAPERREAARDRKQDPK